MKEPDWDLPGMEKFSVLQRDQLKRCIEKEDIVNSIHCLGWALWPTKNNGYYDEWWLRTIADFLEIQNKPFWDEYYRYCEEEERSNPIDDNEIGICFPGEPVVATNGEGA